MPPHGYGPVDDMLFCILTCDSFCYLSYLGEKVICLTEKETRGKLELSKQGLLKFGILFQHQQQSYDYLYIFIVISGYSIAL